MPQHPERAPQGQLRVVELLGSAAVAGCRMLGHKIVKLTNQLHDPSRLKAHWRCRVVRKLFVEPQELCMLLHERWHILHALNSFSYVQREIDGAREGCTRFELQRQDVEAKAGVLDVVDPQSQERDIVA
jgi:hypothetical protein